ncbi:MAG: hypothetical protein ACQEXE_21930 [Bacillota bacterium]|uniref:hypothetical protein n=1 Tax=Bacillales TaxID=1385 RepID=UPI00096FAA92|nr:hypothetical protein [Paenibacillus sp. FSL R5-0490]OMF61714.1 hypothetical protein BK139_05145 [Paenibacillus sp. FSL R5-0490]
MTETLTVRRTRRAKGVPMAPKVAAKRNILDETYPETKAVIQQLVKEEMKKHGYSRQKDPFVKKMNNVLTQYTKTNF